MADRYQTYQDFWCYYLGAHRHRTTRLMHVAGTGLAVLLLLLAVIGGRPGLLLSALVVGYGFAWLAHMLIEKNRPATFTYPVWSLRADFHMAWLWLTGRLDAELLRHDIRT